MLRRCLSNALRMFQFCSNNALGILIGYLKGPWKIHQQFEVLRSASVHCQDILPGLDGSVLGTFRFISSSYSVENYKRFRKKTELPWSSIPAFCRSRVLLARAR